VFFFYKQQFLSFSKAFLNLETLFLLQNLWHYLLSMLSPVLWERPWSYHLTIYSLAGSSKLALEAEIQMLKFEEHQGESSTKFLHSIAGMPSFRDFQIILSTKWKTESALAAWRNKRGHVKMEEFIAKWVLEVEIGKFLWSRYCSQNTSCPFPSSSGLLISFAVLKQKPWERENKWHPKRWWEIPQQDVVHRLRKQ
jgi:hypothetical protein